MPISIILQQQEEAADDVVEDPPRGEHPVPEVEVEVERTPVPDSSPPSPPPIADECKLIYVLSSFHMLFYAFYIHIHVKLIKFPLNLVL